MSFPSKQPCTNPVNFPWGHRTLARAWRGLWATFGLGGAGVAWAWCGHGAGLACDPWIRRDSARGSTTNAHPIQEQSRAEQSRTEQSRAEQSRAEQSRAGQGRAGQGRAGQG
eukprot:gene10464-biopygen13848